jgi:hypothetical protein
MKTVVKYFLTPIFVLFILSSCSFQKRLYTKGFYINKNKTTSKLQYDKDTLPFVAIKHNKEKNENLFASNSEFIILSTKIINGCDTIVLKNGTKILANITEINPAQIKFKDCGAINESGEAINKSNVSYIALANGNREIFETEKNSKSKTNDNPTNNCDTIYTVKGDRVISQEISIGTNETRFKLCNEKRNIYILKNTDITQINYSNSIIKYFENNYVSQYDFQKKPIHRETPTAAILGFILSLVGYIFSVYSVVSITLSGGALGIAFLSLFIVLASLSLCIIGIVKIINNIDTKKGLAWPIIGLIFVIISLLFLILTL